MPVIHKPDSKPLQSNAGLVVPAKFVPSFRVVQAHEKGARNNLIFRMHGGLGDIICAEPAVRYALTHFKDVKFSLATLYSGLFQHLKFDKVFDPSNVSELNLDNYLLYENTDTGNELAAEFLCHTLMHGIDYASLYMWRLILPLEDREIVLIPTQQEIDSIEQYVDRQKTVIIHPGKTWQTRTFPKKWWDEVISGIYNQGGKPVIIGGTVDNGRASVIDVDTSVAIDLRHKLTLMQTVALLQQSKVLISNDSSPVHMATTGNTHIGFLSTVKHHDHIYTWRTPTWLKTQNPDHKIVCPAGYNGIWAWRMQDLAVGRVYDTLDACPNKDKSVKVNECDILDLLKWLPDPKVVSDWAISKLGEQGISVNCDYPKRNCSHGNPDYVICQLCEEK
jgi:ADP-heptose:LPS heptosyltransferase